SSLQAYLLINTTTIIWSIGTHLWYPSIFGWSGYLIMVAGGLFYGGILKMGYDMGQRIQGWYRILALPIAFSVLEWVKTIIPFTKTWWIELVAKSQWTVPEQLQLLSFTGFIGLSFLIMLTNEALTRIIEQLRSPNRALILPIAVLLLPIVNGIYGNVVLKNSVAMLASDSITIGATVDLINQDPEVIALGDQLTAGDGYLADTPEMQQAIFDINRQLSVELTTAKQTQYIDCGDNEYMNAYDAHMVNQLAALSQ